MLITLILLSECCTHTYTKGQLCLCQLLYRYLLFYVVSRSCILTTVLYEYML